MSITIEKISEMDDVALLDLLDDFVMKTDNAKPILAMNPVPMPIGDWIKLRDANQDMLHSIVLIRQELMSRGFRLDK